MEDKRRKMDNFPGIDLLKYDSRIITRLSLFYMVINFKLQRLLQDQLLQENQPVLL